MTGQTPIPHGGSSERLTRATREEAAKLIGKLGERLAPGQYIKVQLGRAAERLSWGQNRTREMYYGTARRIESWELDLLRQVVHETGS